MRDVRKNKDCFNFSVENGFAPKCTFLTYVLWNRRWANDLASLCSRLLWSALLNGCFAGKPQPS
jgi:hypothetical protein